MRLDWSNAAELTKIIVLKSIELLSSANDEALRHTHNRNGLYCAYFEAAFSEGDPAHLFDRGKGVQAWG